MRLFWRKGYEATSMSDLLDATGLSKSSLYSAFGSKHDLMLAAFDAYRLKRRQDMSRMLAQGTGRQGVEAFFHTIVDDAADPEHGSGCMSINQAVELAPYDEGVRRRVEEDLQLIEDGLAQALARGQADGSIGRARPARELAQLLVLGFPGLQVMSRAGLSSSRTSDSLRLLLALLD
ncbi:TetR/AcrR family transcriptional regulator [Brevundimonas intermedia]|nr:TetR/AcrR family transcriptional regulator [Brevundimonas intermedia]